MTHHARAFSASPEAIQSVFFRCTIEGYSTCLPKTWLMGIDGNARLGFATLEGFPQQVDVTDEKGHDGQGGFIYASCLQVPKERDDW